MNPDIHQQKDLGLARRFLWLYCILWLAEGSLRKWVVPGLSMPLLLVRDPVALLVYFYAARAGVFPSNGWLSFLWAMTAMILVQGFIHAASADVSWAVAAFGVRTFVIHLPLIWVVPAVFGRKEIALLGKWVLYMALPLALLMVVQFEVGPNHWLNAATIKGGGQIGSVYGKIRPAAIFSFATGPIHYFTLCGAFAVAGLLIKGLFPRWLSVVGVASAMIAMSVAASRTMVVGCAIVAAFAAIAAFRSGRAMAGIFGLVLILGVAFAGLSRFDILNEGMTAFADRWNFEDEAGRSGGKVVTQRYGSSFTSAFDFAGRVPILGMGAGITSNLYAEKKDFQSPVEGEWERVIYEIGPITGFLFLAFRAALSLRIVALGFAALRTGNYMCILLGSACFLDVLNGNIRQVTSYGYLSVCAGLCLAAFKAFSTEEQPEETRTVDSLAWEKPKLLGRGRFSVGGNPVQP